MSLKITNLLIYLMFIGNVFGFLPVPGRIFFPDEYGKFDFHYTTTLSPEAEGYPEGEISHHATSTFDSDSFNSFEFSELDNETLQIPHQTATTFENDLFNSFEFSELNNDTLQNFTKYKEHIDQLKSIEDFASFFNMSLPEDPFAPGIMWRSRFSNIKPIDDVHELGQATCEPELKKVKIDFEREKGVNYFPTCVRVKRCGGCCTLVGHSCKPKDIEDIYVKVLRVQNGTMVRQKRGAELVYEKVKVKQHNTCNCTCKLQAKDCIKDIHSYDDIHCACVCKNKEEQSKCIESENHYWNYNTCKCFCKKARQCSTGLVFDHETCRCV